MKGGILYIKDLKEMEKMEIDSNSPLYGQICKVFTFNDANYIDYDWIQKQMDYINNLSDRQKHIIRTYTIYSDKLINNYLRKTLKQYDIDRVLNTTNQLNENPFKYQHFDKTGRYTIDKDYKKNIIEYIKKYIKEFTDIIHNSPRLTRPIKVFRGIRSDKYLLNSLINNNNGNKIIKNNDFISTSTYLESATNFMKDSCCLLELTLNVLTPCLFTAHISSCGTEYEVTLAPNTIMRNMKYRKKLLLNSPELYESFNVFLNTFQYDIPSGNVYEFNVSI
jgi:hypothetical protein